MYQNFLCFGGAEYSSVVWLDHISFLRASVGGRLGCFHLSVFVKNAAVHTGARVSVRVSVPVLLGLYEERTLWVLRRLYV